MNLFLFKSPLFLIISVLAFYLFIVQYSLYMIMTEGQSDGQLTEYSKRRSNLLIWKPIMQPTNTIFIGKIISSETKTDLFTFTPYLPHGL